MILGYHASHEQYSPRQLLSYVQTAEKVGFQAVMTSDHIVPWSERQANSGNNWAWIGAAMAVTSIPFGSMAIPGGWRYHPVMLAHLVATLAEIFPRRLRWIALGSGEAMNEAVIGQGWPGKDERNARLETGAAIMRDLLAGKTVDRQHPWFAVEQAKLWSLPEEPPAMFGAALTNETARWFGPWSDGLITVRKPKEELLEMLRLFRENGGEGKPTALQVQVSWATDREEARMAAWDQWRNSAAPPDKLADLRLPADFDAVTADVAPEDMDDVIPPVVEGRDLIDLLHDCADCGFDEIYIHNVSRDQEGFLRFFGREVMPALR